MKKYIGLYIGYINFDFAGSKLNQKADERYIFMLVGGAISHSSKFQLIIALSINEVKFLAICKEEKQAVW